jgi:hypothetical protein
MASSIKKRAENREAMGKKTAQAIDEAGALVAPERPERGGQETKIISIRLDEYDHRRLKSLFAKEGVKLASGIKTAALWIAEMADSGALKVTKAGIIDRRG